MIEKATRPKNPWDGLVKAWVSHFPPPYTDFFKRDEELIAKKEKMANPPPPEIKLASSLRTVKIANNAEKKKSRIANIIALQKAEQAASEKKTKIKPHTNSTYVHSRFNLAQTSEISTNIKMVRQQICEYKANKTKCKEEDVENKKQFHVSPKNKQLALKADMRHKQNSSKLENMETPKKNRSMKYSRKTPLYISEITNFVYSMKKCNRELR
ncbi:hypothetical protein TRFO_14348 [Tritrichomonas foetus]|uniref:Uncharacterized protein n=1 Tax=Tritrichomonas foetus TaxID=1144522 RepID=A0A1J4KZP2_9EUKA|nr:hypothetical protein TRFO_14348 [Tritrichomonas foetus]|eukprot:OHT15174.1 hypothetical protein TRFO_14348 [Tritrichomonas foetus]